MEFFKNPIENLVLLTIFFTFAALYIIVDVTKNKIETREHGQFIAMIIGLFAVIFGFIIFYNFYYLPYYEERMPLSFLVDSEVKYYGLNGAMLFLALLLSLNLFEFKKNMRSSLFLFFNFIKMENIANKFKAPMPKVYAQREDYEGFDIEPKKLNRDEITSKMDNEDVIPVYRKDIGKVENIWRKSNRTGEKTLDKSLIERKKEEAKLTKFEDITEFQEKLISYFEKYSGEEAKRKYPVEMEIMRLSQKVEMFNMGKFYRLCKTGSLEYELLQAIEALTTNYIPVYGVGYLIKYGEWRKSIANKFAKTKEVRISQKIMNERVKRAKLTKFSKITEFQEKLLKHYEKLSHNSAIRENRAVEIEIMRLAKLSPKNLKPKRFFDGVDKKSLDYELLCALMNLNLDYVPNSGTGYYIRFHEWQNKMKG